MADTTNDDPMQDFVNHLIAAGELAHRSPVADVLGDGLRRELGYVLASVRARFPSYLAGAQATLLP